MKKFLFNLTHWAFNWDEYQQELELFRCGYDFRKDLREFNDYAENQLNFRGFTDKEKLAGFFYLSKGKYQQVVGTGGTTGLSFKFLCDGRQLASRFALIDYRFEEIGLKKGERMVKIWYPMLGHNKIQLLKERLRRKIENEHYISYFGILKKDLSDYLVFILRKKPVLIEGYGKAVYLIAKYILDKGLMPPPSVKWIVTSAGPTTREERKTIRTAFEAEVFDRYGCSEFGEIAHQLPDRDYYEQNPALELFVLEEGEPIQKMKKIEEAKDGKYFLFVTDPRNYATPFWRYYTKDIVRVENGNIVEVIGRTGQEAEIPVGDLQKITKVRFL